MKQVIVDEPEGMVTVELLDPAADHATEHERYHRHHQEDRP